MSKEKHTPIVSRQQQKFFGAEIGRAKRGEETKSGMSEETLAEHLRESKGKDLPEKVEKQTKTWPKICPYCKGKVWACPAGYCPHCNKPWKIPEEEKTSKLCKTIDSFINKMDNDKDVKEMRSEIKSDNEQRKKQLAENISSKATGEQLVKQVDPRIKARANLALREQRARERESPYKPGFQPDVYRDDKSTLEERVKARGWKIPKLAKQVDTRKLLKSITNIIENIEKADFPQVCPNCNAKIYGVITPVKCPKCNKPWEESKKVEKPNKIEKKYGEHRSVSEGSPVERLAEEREERGITEKPEEKESWGAFTGGRAVTRPGSPTPKGSYYAGSRGGVGRSTGDPWKRISRRGGYAHYVKELTKSIDEFIEKQTVYASCSRCRKYHRRGTKIFDEHKDYLGSCRDTSTGSRIPRTPSHIKQYQEMGKRGEL